MPKSVFYTKRLFASLKSSTFWLLVLAGNLFLMISVTVVYFLEKDTPSNIDSYLDTIWWGVSTITTVGYGDVVPETVPARIIGIVLMYTGTVMFIAFTSLVAAYLVRREVTEEIEPIEKELEEEVIESEKIAQILREINSRLDRLEKMK